MSSYIDSVKHFLPIKKLTEIYTISPTTKKRHKCEAQLWRYSNGKCTIGFYLKYQAMVFHNNNTISTKLKPCSKLDLVLTLAHELAHLVEMDHNTKHKRLEIKILKKFLKNLDDEGYISEEHELKK